MKEEERCKAINVKGEICKLRGNLAGYCPHHFVKYKSIRKIKNKKNDRQQ